ncbi:Protein of unknown function DUF2071 [Emticicia oligotrophica DSM 17448]|uniref:DUF2071 domain-containing protein n=1 Tax=Emticicia oligotrophica (strain DSM 17448 / CIP 109782 / MTCC 6937 / GPTSA100-15) TaxID=929562 RepID=A0ABM5N599_EMTOG|nr:DUF2071 domain-containing protein [Emticicia oligotrophica]AFK04642.1 Protein of unknown function DUF2071 [Emticicia oligotrophica DSM 17448]
MFGNTFLKAKWQNLVMANYEVSPEILKKHLPYKTELDFWNGRCYVSLVGFQFFDTQVLGIKFPFHTNFEEVNLRFYVRYNDNGEWKRGVVFVKEIVPKAMITLIANSLYRENYATHPCNHKIITDNHEISAQYEWKSRSGWNSLQVWSDLTPQTISLGSEEEFITEHYWGYAAYSTQKTNEYQVQHPRWLVHRVNKYQILCNFEELYGKEFAFLKDKQPISVLHAQGSEVAVLKGKIIT